MKNYRERERPMANRQPRENTVLNVNRIAGKVEETVIPLLDRENFHAFAELFIPYATSKYDTRDKP